MSSQPGDPAQETIRLFAQYLRRLGAGEAVDIEALCAQHPLHAVALRDLLARWRGMVSRLGEPDWHPDDVEARLLELLDRGDADADSGLQSLAAPLQRLRERGWDTARFDDRGEVARGAMGRVVRVWDRELRRSMARKVLLERRSRSPDAAHESTVRLARFLEEAQITAQLEHPGIVPVHDLGIDADGNAFFTMRLVRGEDLRSVFEKVAEGKDGWNLTRALGVLAKLCEALAFAHSKGVVHRDLKPANVMVGRFGEVYVMDWGLARVMDRPDTRDLRVQHSPQSQSMELSTARTDAESSHGSPLRTMDGHVVGTPAYMPPEQARGELALLGPRSDVYAVGAMLYHLLSGHMPYLEEGSPVSPYEIWAQVRERPPRSIRSIARGKPPELIAICEKAMSRVPSQRYADVNELREDLQRFLENRVVLAYRTGPAAEARKWARRNPLVAGSIAALLIVSVVAGLLLAAKEASRGRIERRSLDEFLAPVLVQRAQTLWPIHPDQAQRMESWLDEALPLISVISAYESELQQLRGSGVLEAVPEAERGSLSLRARLDRSRRRLVNLESTRATTQARLESEPPDTARAAEDHRIAGILEREIPGLQSEIERMERSIAPAGVRRFATFAKQLEHDRLQNLVGNLQRLTRDGDGLIADVQSRLERSRVLAEQTIESRASEWERARADIADLGSCPMYEGLVLPPQVGLVPLRRDPASGLWEFWHVLSGERPEPAASGGYLVTPDTGVVMVLIPGGDVMLGCSREDLKLATQWEFMDEIPPRDLRLEPYLLSKYELTQGQWLRLGGERRGESWAGSNFGQDPMNDLSHPVEDLEATYALEMLAHWGLSLPTEAQWEHAALAGLPAAEEWSMDLAMLERLTNLLCDHEQSDPPVPKPFVPWSERMGDVYVAHSPAGYFPPNAWGLHDMIGNVAEWCRDGYLQSGYEEKDEAGRYVPIRCDPRTGELVPRATTEFRVLRGASYKVLPSRFRLSERREWHQDIPAPEGGVRPSMDLHSG